jgi:choline dehydrogenase
MRINAITTRVGLLRPAARGTVELRSADPTDAPVIRYESFADPNDLRDMTIACRETRRILSTQPLAEHIIREITPNPTADGESAWADVLRRDVVTGKHQAGTCKMGQDSMSVVDPQLRVRGVDCLRVVDLSVAPVIVSGNTNAAAMMIGELGADLLRGRGQATFKPNARTGCGPGERSARTMHPTS